MDNLSMNVRKIFAAKQEEERLDLTLQLLVLKKLESDTRIPKEAKLSYLVTQTNDVLESSEKAIREIEKVIPYINNLLTFPQMFKNKEKELLHILFELSRIDVDQYVENLLEQGTNRLSKAEGESVTPNQINDLLIRLLNPSQGSLYDGTAGLGGTLVKAGQIAPSLNLYGEEINLQAGRIAKLNLFLQGKEEAEIKTTDMLESPAFHEKGRLKQFDYVAMHPPFSMRVSNTKVFEQDQFNRFIYGPITQRNVDFAFVMHGIASLKETGKASFLMTGSPLMRGGADQEIRQNLLTADLVEAVIALPEKLLMNTSILTYIVIINKNKVEERKGKVLFINATNEFVAGRWVNELTEEQIEKMIQTYEENQVIEDYSALLNHDELEDSILLPEKYIVEKVIEDEYFGQVRIQANKLIESEKVLPLGDCVSRMYRGLNITASTVKEGEGPLEIIKLSDVENGFIKLDHLTKGTLLRSSNIDKYKVEAGDLIISNRGSHMKIAVVPKVKDNVILSHNFIGMKLKEGIDPYYVKMYLESPIGQFELAQQQVGSTILSISPSNLKKVKVLLTDQADVGSLYEQAFIDYERKIKEIERERQLVIESLYESAGLFNFMTIKE